MPILYVCWWPGGVAIGRLCALETIAAPGSSSGRREVSFQRSRDRPSGNMQRLTIKRDPGANCWFDQQGPARGLPAVLTSAICAPGPMLWAMRIHRRGCISTRWRRKRRPNGEGPSRLRRVAPLSRFATPSQLPYNRDTFPLSNGYTDCE